MLIAQSLDIHAGGSIECIENEVVSTVEPTIEPTDKPTTEPTDEPYADDLIPNNSVDRKPVRLKNASAYLFGRSDTLMQPNDGIQRAEACSVVYRLLKQNNKLAGYSIPSDSSFKDLKEEWYYSAIEFMNSIGVYNSKPNPDERKISPTNYITRGEAAKIFVFALGLQESEDKEEFVDLHEGDKYYEYINSLYQEGYLHGYEDGTIRVDEQITRAEYCKIYNLVIGRDDDYELVYLEDARVQCPKDNYLWYDVKAEDAVICPFADINEDDWYYEVMMRATCTFNDYKVDWNSRGDRNSLDDYDVE